MLRIIASYDVLREAVADGDRDRLVAALSWEDGFVFHRQVDKMVNTWSSEPMGTWCQYHLDLRKVFST
jgi:hypothetical protein